MHVCESTRQALYVQSGKHPSSWREPAGRDSTILNVLVTKKLLWRDDLLMLFECPHSRQYQRQYEVNAGSESVGVLEVMLVLGHHLIGDDEQGKGLEYEEHSLAGERKFRF